MKKWNEYKLLLVDLDGTLYFQTPCRLHMIWSLAKYYILHLNKWKDLPIILKYRSLREKWENSEDDSMEQMQYQAVADKLGCDINRVETVVTKWMLQEPLDALYRYRDENLIAVLEEIRHTGSKVVIYSDYPVKDKVKALQIGIDGAYYSGDAGIQAMKPSPKGILHILGELQVRPEDAIMIGDRMEKDGMAAKQAGISFAVLDKNKEKRKEQIGALK